MRFATIYHAPKQLDNATILQLEQDFNCELAIVPGQGLNVYAKRRLKSTAIRVAYWLALEVTEIAMPSRGLRLDDLLSNASNPYGAPMGRSNDTDPTFDGKLHVQAVNLDSGGYDKGGAYWGGNMRGAYLYAAFSSDGDQIMYMRVASRTEAIAQARAEFPLAKIHGDKRSNLAALWQRYQRNSNEAHTETFMAMQAEGWNVDMLRADMIRLANARVG